MAKSNERQVESYINLVKITTDEIFRISNDQEFEGKVSHIGISLGTTMDLSRFIPTVLIKFQILIRSGSRRAPKYRWRKDMCKPNITLAERIYNSYIETNKEINRKKKKDKKGVDSF